MKRVLWFIPLFLLMAAGAVAISQWMYMNTAASRAQTAMNGWKTVQLELSESEQLARAVEQVAWGARPDTDILALARQAMLEAGLPANQLQGVSPAGDRPVPGQPAGAVQLREQSVRITLRSVSMKALGDYFRAWAAIAPRWTVTSIDLALIASGRSTSQQSGLYTVTLTVTAPYAEDSQR